MPDSGGFIQRWSKRKVEAAVPEAAQPAEPREEAVPADDQPEAAGAPPPLPSLDDVIPGRDLAAFFSKHVPDELRNAALRKAWLSDPSISGFIEMAENQWDFNSPGGALAAGFGAIPAGFDVEKLARAIMGEKPDPADAVAAVEPVEDAENSAAMQQVEAAPSIENTAVLEKKQDSPQNLAQLDSSRIDVAPQQSQPAQAVAARRHGRALPYA